MMMNTNKQHDDARSIVKLTQHNMSIDNRDANVILPTEKLLFGRFVIARKKKNEREFYWK